MADGPPPGHWASTGGWMYVVAHRARCYSMYSICLSAVEGVVAGKVGSEGEDGDSKKTV